MNDGSSYPAAIELGFPDLALVGAARSGTSTLAARLSRHSLIDGGAIKEPNYFSRHLDRGSDWYDSLFEPRTDGVLRLDASMSYSVPQHPEALRNLARAAPTAFVVYAVRDPLPRAVSHYRLLSRYFTSEHGDFGDAIRNNAVYLGTSDYGRWLDEITKLFDASRVLVVPFSIITQGDAATDVVLDLLGLPREALGDSDREVHQNQVVEFHHPALRKSREALRRTPAYPWLRRRIGADRMRRLRGLLTREAPDLTVEQALSSCTASQRQEITELVERSRAAASAVLAEQDRRLGLDWDKAWRESLSSGPM